MGFFDNFFRSKEAKEYYREAKMFEEKDFGFEFVEESKSCHICNGYPKLKDHDGLFLCAACESNGVVSHDEI